MRYQGKINVWKDGRGFGFINPDGGGAQVFVHISSFANRQKRPSGNEIVTYELESDTTGRSRAKKVLYVGECRSTTCSPIYNVGTIILAVSFIFFVLAATLVDKLPKTVPFMYLAASAITFLIYARDKSAAENNRWRTQESTLHLLELIGGWPGAMVAQRLLRHKSKKKSYQIVFWMVVSLNCIVLGMLLTKSGTALLRSLIDWMVRSFN